MTNQESKTTLRDSLARTDVLGIMAVAAPHYPPLNAARAAVAELIAADREYDDARDLLGAPLDVCETEESSLAIVHRYRLAKTRRDTALANIGGGK